MVKGYDKKQHKETPRKSKGDSYNDYTTDKEQNDFNTTADLLSERAFLKPYRKKSEADGD